MQFKIIKGANPRKGVDRSWSAFSVADGLVTLGQQSRGTTPGVQGGDHPGCGGAELDGRAQGRK